MLVFTTDLIYVLEAEAHLMTGNYQQSEKNIVIKKSESFDQPFLTEQTNFGTTR